MAANEAADRWRLTHEPAGQPRLKIFINYRRDDADYPAGQLHQDLTEEAELQAHFDVFMDIKGISPLQKFQDVIMEKLLSSDVMLVVIGRQWLTITDDSGQPRLEQEDDLLRKEIEAALEQELRVVPVLLRGVSMPTRDKLPPSLGGLTEWQAYRMDSSDWKENLGELVERLDEVHALKGPGVIEQPEETEDERAERLHEAAKRARQARRRRRIARIRSVLTRPVTIGIAAVLVVALVAAIVFWPGPDGDWTDISDAIPATGQTSVMTAAASVPNASIPYLIGGQVGDDAALWKSVDGEDWDDPVIDQFASPSGAQTSISVIVAPRKANLLAIGEEESAVGETDVAVWHSRDGAAQTWERVATIGGSGSQVAVSARRVLKPTEEFLLIGGHEDLDGDRAAALWRAPTPAGPWERVVDETLQQGDDSGITRILCFPVDEECDLIVALGWSSQGGDEDATVWTSEIGSSDSWTRRVERAEGDQRITDAVPFGEGLVAVGVNGDDAAVWRSLDGVDFTPVSDLERPGVQRVEVVVTPTTGDGQATGLIAAGSHAEEGAAQQDAAVWASSDGTTWSEATAADAFGGAGNQSIRGIVARLEPIIAVGSNGSAPGVWCRGC